MAAATPRSGSDSANDSPVRRRLAVWQVSETTAAAGSVSGPVDGIREVVGAGAGVPDPADRAAVPDVHAERRTGGQEVDEVGRGCSS